MRRTGQFRLAMVVGQVALIGALVWLVVGMAATPAAAADTQIDIQGFAFNPSTLTIPAGTKVTWTNKDSATHTVTSDTGAFDSKNLANGASFSFTFSQAGTFAYHCAIHSRMVATITVTAAGAPAAGAPVAATAAPGAVLPKTGEVQGRPASGALLWVGIAAALVIVAAGITVRRRTASGRDG